MKSPYARAEDDVRAYRYVLRGVTVWQIGGECGVFGCVEQPYCHIREWGRSPAARAGVRLER